MGGWRCRAQLCGRLARHAPPDTVSVRDIAEHDSPSERSKDSAGDPTRFQMLVRPGNPDFLDLPWREPLAEWQSERIVEVTRASTATSCAS